jgi:hypothetical protein
MTTTVIEPAAEVEQTPREQLIAGLHALADFLAANPGLPVHHGHTFHIHPALDGSDEEQCAAVDDAARLLGVEVVAERGHVEAIRMFGPVELKVAAISADTMAIHTSAMAYKHNLEAAAALAADAALTPDDPSLPGSNGTLTESQQVLYDGVLDIKDGRTHEEILTDCVGGPFSAEDIDAVREHLGLSCSDDEPADPWAGLPVAAAATAPDPHADCPSYAGQEVTCDRCGKTYRCTPAADYYCAVEGDHCCEPCLTNGRRIVVAEGGR